MDSFVNSTGTTADTGDIYISSFIFKSLDEMIPIAVTRWKNKHDEAKDFLEITAKKALDNKKPDVAWKLLLLSNRE